MKMQYDLVVFDWEGTIAEDSYGFVISIMAREAHKFKLKGFDRFIARQYVTFGLSNMVNRLFPDLTMHQHEQFIQVVQDSFTRNQQEICLIDGVANTIKKLSEAGIKLAIATNRGLKSLQKVLHLSGLEDYFDVIRTASEAPAKPCPQMLEEIILAADSTIEQTIMVGDSVVDMEMAKFIGVDALGVDFYHEQKDVLLQAGAKFVLDDYQQLLDYLKI